MSLEHRLKNLSDCSGLAFGLMPSDGSIGLTQLTVPPGMLTVGLY
jgi:hypothetical protein